jgi:hypothetical protein
MYWASFGSKIVSIFPASYRHSRQWSPLMPARSRPATSIDIAKMCWFVRRVLASMTWPCSGASAASASCGGGPFCSSTG